MNRTTTALLAALEAVLVVAIGVGIALVPLTVLWATQFGLAIDWVVFWRAAVDVWLLGNGVDLTVQLDPAVVTTLGLPGSEAPFTLTIALLGYGLLAVLLGRRTGARAAETPYRWVGAGAAIACYGLLATVLSLTAGTDAVRPSLPQGILLPTAVYAAGVLSGVLSGAFRGQAAGALVRRYRTLPAVARGIAATALRGGTAAAAAIVAVSAVAVFVLILSNYATVIGLYETVQSGLTGGIVLTLLELALIPNLVVWAAAWLVGPGIAVGVGTSVSPVGTALGSVPGLPILGVLPHGTLAFGFLGLLVPVLIGFLAAAVTRQRQARTDTAPPTVPQQLVTGLATGIVAGILLGLLAWWSGGAMGPGRLVEVGPDPLLVGLLTAVEVGVAAGAGLLTPHPFQRSRATPKNEPAAKR
ncbi:DUF6350 family protein [Cryobacterium sp. HLT2-28]|uniref:cell division protein PerM n=1 Tax=Cryobacterium sp. HLT2-28 TaxID=1259146 RepID=UPI00106B942C|nr:DUF6350 family protein [Cryobacterium sp. HLT2-28]TFB96881.1 hypothetical protein E3O48_04180 [Cryobacterium sp. HLT2-28]